MQSINYELFEELIGSWHQSENVIQELRAKRPLNHNQEKVLISTTIAVTFGVAPLNTTWFRRFHTHQVVANHIRWLTLPPFGYWNRLPNREKWCIPLTIAAPVITLLPIHWYINAQTLVITGQLKNKCSQSSNCWRQKIHGRSLVLFSMPLWWRAPLVGSLSKRRRQPNTKTLEGRSFLQSFFIASNTPSSIASGCRVSRRKL
jgi:hypothetical protein